MLTLKEFMKQTLTEISDAIQEFSLENSDSGASANPPIAQKAFKGRTDIIEGQYLSDKKRPETIIPVTFDVAVTAIDDASAKAGAGIHVVSFFKAEGSVETGTTKTSANRVQYTIPLRLPDTGDDGTLSPFPTIGTATQR